MQNPLNKEPKRTLRKRDLATKMRAMGTTGIKCRDNERRMEETGIRCRDNRQRTPEYRREHDTKAGLNPEERKKKKREPDDSRTKQKRIRIESDGKVYTLFVHQDGVDEAAERSDEAFAGEGIGMAVELAEPALTKGKAGSYFCNWF